MDVISRFIQSEIWMIIFHFIFYIQLSCDSLQPKNLIIEFQSWKFRLWDFVRKTRLNFFLYEVYCVIADDHIVPNSSKGKYFVYSKNQKWITFCEDSIFLSPTQNSTRPFVWCKQKNRDKMGYFWDCEFYYYHYSF